MSNNNLRQWSARMEAGEQDDELLALAARLERAGRNEPSTIPLDYRRQLRRELLARYPAAQAAGRQWKLVQTVAAIGGLALIVMLTWFTMSSLQRPSFGGAPAAVQGTEPNTSDVSEYTYHNHALSGGLLLEMTESADGATETQAFLMPGVDLSFHVTWSLPPDSPPLTAFAHLLDENGAVVTQGDAPLTADGAFTPERYTSNMQLPIPESLPPGRYQLVAGLYDPANSGRVPFVSPQGETTQLLLEEYEVLSPDAEPLSSEEQAVLDDLEGQQEPLHLSLEDGDALDVRAVTPAAGTVLSGTAPLRFTVTLDHALSSLTQGILEVRVVAIEGENGRGVGLATIDLESAGVERSTVEVVANTDELPAPTELGLWLQLKPDAGSAPILIEMPEAYRWHYVP